MTAAERFWSKVAVAAPDDCWPWLAGRFTSGYGAFSVTHTKLVRAHRFAFEITHGEIPAGVVIRHRCDNPPCCNPRHLLDGTNLDNVRDRDERSRTARGERVATAKLCALDVALIRADPRGARPVAVDFGVSRSLIQQIRRGSAWRHL